MNFRQQEQKMEHIFAFFLSGVARQDPTAERERGTGSSPAPGREGSR